MRVEKREERGRDSYRERGLGAQTIRETHTNKHTQPRVSLMDYSLQRSRG